jgi:putative NADH-flavin reductase
VKRLDTNALVADLRAEELALVPAADLTVVALGPYERALVTRRGKPGVELPFPQFERGVWTGPRARALNAARKELPMRIVVFGATGNVGRHVVKEALDRGHAVTGIARNPSRPSDPRARVVQGDATSVESIVTAVRGADAVVNAISPRPGSTGKAPSLVTVARTLLDALPKAGVKRLLVVGGAGSLQGPDGVQLVDAPGFPDAYKPEALAQRDALDLYRAEGGALDWTYLSPAPEIGPGERTGKYRTSGDQVIPDAKGKSFISFQDFAVAVLDELEKPRFLRKRFAVAH